MKPTHLTRQPSLWITALLCAVLLALFPSPALANGKHSGRGSHYHHYNSHYNSHYRGHYHRRPVYSRHYYGQRYYGHSNYGRSRHRSITIRLF